MGFKINQTVYHYQYGEGTISDIFSGVMIIKFENTVRTFFPSGIEHINDKFPTLSCTPYDLVSGGFSLPKNNTK